MPTNQQIWNLIDLYMGRGSRDDRLTCEPGPPATNSWCWRDLFDQSYIIVSNESLQYTEQGGKLIIVVVYLTLSCMMGRDSEVI